MFKKIYLFFFLLTLLFLGVFSLLFDKQEINVEAAAPPVLTPLHGFGWSETTGWISFNCENGGPTGNNICSTSNYSVVKDASGNLNGYGWGDATGWVKFGGLPKGGFPAGPGTQASNAALNDNGTSKDFTDDYLTGWVRVCSGMYDQSLNQTTPNNTCTGSSRTDGFDGWISLKGSSVSPSYSYSTKVDGSVGTFCQSDSCPNFDWAYGSDVIGWINLNGLSTASIPTLTASLSANPSSGSAPLTSTLTATRTGGTASGAISYRFKCKDTQAWSSSQSSNTYSCTYSSDNTYTASAEVSQQGVTATPIKIITVISVPSAPTGLTAIPVCEGKISLSWNASTGSAPITYNLIRGVSPIYSGSATSFIDTPPTIGVNYSYSVFASNSAGNSESSNTASATAENTPCSGTCTGTLPAGSGVLLSTIPQINSPWTYTDTTPLTIACTWTCKTGYRHVGTESRCRPIPGFEEI